ncbi:unnamed protein product [Lactuca saligna]|uniref:Uncharacterized protein n=1 Tax=Lactuca saligna TaxID=75948 RepID=A0AA36EM71_LACSI|nr:unnamed protein product [Lactuca saligna]
MFEKVPLSYLSKAYPTAIYHISKEMVNFEVNGNKTSISKAHYYKFLGFSSSADLIQPESVSISSLISMFHLIDICEILPYLKSALETFELPKRGGKQQLQAIGDVPQKKKHQQKPKNQRMVIGEDSDYHTQGKDLREDYFVHADTVHYSKLLPMISKPIISAEIPKLSTSLSTPPESDVYQHLKEPTIDLSQTRPSSLPISTSVPDNSFIPPISQCVFEPTSMYKPLCHSRLWCSLILQQRLLFLKQHRLLIFHQSLAIAQQGEMRNKRNKNKKLLKMKFLLISNSRIKIEEAL